MLQIKSAGVAQKVDSAHLGGVLKDSCTWSQPGGPQRGGADLGQPMQGVMGLV